MEPSASDPIEVLDHDQAWFAQYRSYERLLRDALGETALRIEHIGSTAVPGLAAKPVIDVQVSVADVDALDQYRPGLESIGMLSRPHPEDPEPREFFRPDGPRVVHVHVVDYGGECERLYLLHRDYLRANPTAAAQYSALKRALAADFRDARQHYQDAKGPFIEQLTNAAEAWASATGWTAATSWVRPDEPRDMIVARDGISLSTAVTGEGEPQVLWLHGGPGIFDYLAPAAAAFPVGTHVRFDQRGCGRSDRAGPFTYERYLRDVEDVSRAYGLEQPIVAGHSFGATLALLYALRHERAVAGVLYVSGVGLGREWRAAHHAEHGHRLTEVQRERRSQLFARSAGWTWDEEVEYRRLSYLPDVADRDRAADLIEPLATAPWRLNLDCNASMGPQCEQDLDEERCRDLRCPVLVVHGAQDTRPPWATGSLVAALPNVRRVVLPDTGHLPFVEAPSEFAAAVQPFFENAMRSSGSGP